MEGVFFMDSQELYKAAVNTMINNMNTVRVSNGDISVFDNMSLCIVISDKQYIYMGNNSTKIEGGSVVNTCAEYEAVSAMVRTGETHIVQMITINYKTNEVVKPCQDCLKMIVETNPENRFCSVIVSPTEVITLNELIEDDSEKPVVEEPIIEEKTVEEKTPDEPAQNNAGMEEVRDFSSGDFDFGFIPDDVPVSQGVDFVTDVAADESNPFYEPPKAPKQQAASEQYAQQAMAGFDDLKVLNSSPIPSNTPVYAVEDTPVQSIYGQSQNYNSYYTQNTAGMNQTSPSQYFQPVSPYGNGGSNYAFEPDDTSYPTSGHSSVPTAHSVHDSLNTTSRYNSSTETDSGSVYKQRLNDLLRTDSKPAEIPEKVAEKTQEKPLSRLEMMRLAKEKKKQAKIDAKFEKKLRKKGMV
jgi:cytidine deaminase